MLKGFFLFIAVVFISDQAFSDGDRKENQEYIFQCGALYGVMMKAYEENKEYDQYRIYKEKFDTLAKNAESTFERNGKNKKEAEAYMQKHVDLLVQLAQTDGKSLPSLRVFCDKLFQ
ncbi:hypothetical protein ACU8MP_25425 (plasmid) [Rhizobium leguminosarum]